MGEKLLTALQKLIFNKQLLLMINLIKQLFTQWEIISSLVGGTIPVTMLNSWDKLLSQIEIHLLISENEQASILKAFSGLSNRIYEQYRRHRRVELHLLLDRLERLLAYGCYPSNYKRMLIKINIAGLQKQIKEIFHNLAVPPSISTVIIDAIKDTNQKGIFSNNAEELLSDLVLWLKKYKQLPTEQPLIDYLISVNFNHPGFSEYLISYYSKPIGNSLTDLANNELYLMERQRHIENLGLRDSCGLCLDNSALATQLKNYLKSELKWLQRRGKRLNYLKELAGETNPPLQKPGKKLKTKWPGDKSDLVELAYALYVYMRTRGSKVMISELANWFEDTFGISLSRYSHRFAEIKMRKSTRPSKFLDTLVEEFLNYVEEGDAYSPT
ncbi:hypothetical protein G7092_01750 [Mucilaginibacter sp. HC2]|jgi:hypothetical protein|uniref:RteC domain-containing protein n=1 Tax=Mucilaginibacter inviolabilis TaxID=2714892 RepID=UPI00140D6993|nr:RteC domain-containing protein [Mucilaginibacter inviolabilis]NHA02497.1 hypothetical protein [Mucilaginibacter inviolabilis]